MSLPIEQAILLKLEAIERLLSDIKTAIAHPKVAIETGKSAYSDEIPDLSHRVL
jgi:hypothetical protein